MPDMVNHPPHYTAGPIECIDAIAAALGPEGFRAYCRGTAIKYAWRAGRKDDARQDLDKGSWYLNRGAQVEVDEDLSPDREWQLLEEIATLKQRLQDQERQWLEAQDSLRAEWLKVVDVLGQIVPVIPGETTLGMVERVREKMEQEEADHLCTQAQLRREEAWTGRIHQAAEANGWNMMMAPLDQWIIGHLIAGNTWTIQRNNRLWKLTCALRKIAEDRSGSIGAADWMIEVAKEALGGEA